MQSNHNPSIDAFFMNPSNPETPFKCPFCPYTSKDIVACLNHTLNQHVNETNIQKLQRPNTSSLSQIFSCKFCLAVFSQKTQFYAHLINSHSMETKNFLVAIFKESKLSKPFPNPVNINSLDLKHCSICRKAFSEPDAMIFHALEKHFNCKSFIVRESSCFACSLCSFPLKSEASISGHLSQYHREFIINYIISEISQKSHNININININSSNIPPASNFPQSNSPSPSNLFEYNSPSPPNFPQDDPQMDSNSQFNPPPKNQTNTDISFDEIPFRYDLKQPVINNQNTQYKQSIPNNQNPFNNQNSFNNQSTFNNQNPFNNQNTFNNQNAFNHQNDLSNQGGLTHCMFCSRTFTELTPMYAHALISHFPLEEINRIFVQNSMCILCGTRMRAEKSILNHLSSAHSEKCREFLQNAKSHKQTIVSNLTGNEKDEFSNGCMFCGKYYNNSSEQLPHILTKHIGESRIIKDFCKTDSSHNIKCSICSQTLKTFQSIISHLSVRHPNETYQYIKKNLKETQPNQYPDDGFF